MPPLLRWNDRVLFIGTFCIIVATFLLGIGMMLLIDYLKDMFWQDAVMCYADKSFDCLASVIQDKSLINYYVSLAIGAVNAVTGSIVAIFFATQYKLGSKK